MSMRLRWITMAVAWALTASSAQATQSADPTCPADSVRAGGTCLDRFEESVWRVPSATTTNAALVSKIRSGTATLADLSAGGATQRGVSSHDYAPCTDNGQNCANDLFALSLPSATPAAFITWFQAQEACANSAKRMPTNAEWQIGADGTPDPGPDDGTTDCNSAATGTVSLTGERSRCVSSRGAFDMVGNLDEWVADWVPAMEICTGWASFSNDYMCLAGASETDTHPDALVRGGSFQAGLRAGPLAIRAREPFSQPNSRGFRCVRPVPEPGHVAQLLTGVAMLAALARSAQHRNGEPT
jgi:hypothetical protein